VAVAPPAPDLVPPYAQYAAHPPIVFAALRNIFEGLERPPRTI
jgi:hypothetical protein